MGAERAYRGESVMTSRVIADIPEWDMRVDERGRVSFAHPGQAHAWLRRFAGTCIAAQFYEHREKRSGRQNRGFHSMITPWAKQEGHRIDDLKADLLREVFGTLESVSLVTGEVREVLAEPHTSTLTVGQFCELIDRTLEIAAGVGVILVPPDEYKRQKSAAAKKAARSARVA
jgi:hypothetical protein